LLVASIGSADISGAIGAAPIETAALTGGTMHATDALVGANSHALDPAGTAYAEAVGSSLNHAVERATAGPLRILVTRQTERDKLIEAQNLLASLGYLKPQKFTGRMGGATIAAIREFQKANGLRETGAFTSDLATVLYAAAGKQEPPAGRLFVRQNFSELFAAPIQIRDSDKPLGTHMFAALESEEHGLNWLALSIEGDDSAQALDRIDIPETMRVAIERLLTPGSALIVGDVAVDSSILPEGDDFLVLAKTQPSAIETGVAKPAKAGAKVTAIQKPPKAATKVRKITQAVPKRRVKKAPPIQTRRIYDNRWHSFGGGIFSRW
jgi:peptidoglycan hydrolase-like protein with peptidoglycan-binding domain